MSIKNNSRYFKSKDSDYYLIEEVTDKFYKDGEPWYKVWWKGYPKSESTWEPLSNFLNYTPILEYERKLKRNKYGNSFEIISYPEPKMNGRMTQRHVKDGYEHETHFFKNNQTNLDDVNLKHVVKRYNIKKRIPNYNSKFSKSIPHDFYALFIILLLVVIYYLITNNIDTTKSTSDTFYCPNTKCEIFKLYPYDKDICLIEKNITNEGNKEKAKYKKKEKYIEESTYDDMLIL